MEEFYLPSNGAGRIHCALWTPETAPRAVVQITALPSTSDAMAILQTF